MCALKQQISDLAALLQVYLLQEHSMKDWKVADQECYGYFKNFVQSAQKTQKTPPATPPAPVARPLPASPLSPQPKPLQPKTPTSITPSSPKKAEPVPEAIPEKKSEPKLILNQNIELRPIVEAKVEDLADVKRVMQENLPTLQIVETIPDDSKAKKIRAGWLQKDCLCTVVFLSFQENQEEAAFMTQVMQAVKKLLAPANIVPATNLQNEEMLNAILNGPDVRFIIAPTKGLQSTPYLWQHFKSDVNQLGQKPVMLLEEWSAYMQDQQKKAALWRALQGLFNK